MWELLLTWLPLLGGILTGTMLLLGIMWGVSHSLKKVFGSSHGRLFGDGCGENFYFQDCSDLAQDFYNLVVGNTSGIALPDIGTLPDCLLAGGLMSLSVGLAGLVLIHYGYIDEVTLAYGISLGWVVGIVYSWLRRAMWNVDISVSWHVLVWSIVGTVFGAIVSGIGYEMIIQPDYILNAEKRTLWVAGILIALGSMSGIRKMKNERIVSLQFLLDAFLAGLTGGCAGMFLSGMLSEFFGGLGWIMSEPGLGLCGGVALGILPTGFLVAASMLMTTITAGLVTLVSTPLVILVGVKPIICPHCLRYTKPSHPQSYRDGTRCCEHCHTWTDQTNEPGKVIFTFGDFSEADLQKLQAGAQRVILHTNPTFGHVQADTQNPLFLASRFHLDHYEHPVDVSEVYIDTATCDPWCIDRFITYILNHPPKYGVRSVKILYRGKLDELGTNLNNALRNNFTSVTQVC